MAPKKQQAKNPKGRGQQRHAKEDWIRAALDTLISQGVENVKILVLSSRLETARSSFYWHFENREDLLDTLLEHWRATNTRAIIDSASEPADTIIQAIVNVHASWFSKGPFNTRLDFAIRDWARRSGSVRRALDLSEDARIAALRGMFQRFDYPVGEADMRARILYSTHIPPRSAMRRWTSAKAGKPGVRAAATTWVPDRARTHAGGNRPDQGNPPAVIFQQVFQLDPENPMNKARKRTRL